jgi:rRNA-processing protein FCF1
MVVTRLPDGRYCVAYTDGSVSRRSYTPLVEQVVRQAQRAGGIPVRTDDEVLRQHCREAAVPLIEWEGQEA